MGTATLAQKRPQVYAKWRRGLHGESSEIPRNSGRLGKGDAGGSDARPPAIIHAFEHSRPRVGVALAMQGETSTTCASSRLHDIAALAIERRIELRLLTFRPAINRPIRLPADRRPQD